MYGSVFVPLINAIKSFFPILLINEVLFIVKKKIMLVQFSNASCLVVIVCFLYVECVCVRAHACLCAYFH